MKINRSKLAKGFVSLLPRYSAQQLVPVLAHEIMRAKLANQLELVIKDINQELLHQQGYLEADATSAHELSQAVRQQLVDAIKAHTGANKVGINYHSDPSVVGGVLARTPELELNLTIEAKLRKLAL